MNMRARGDYVYEMINAGAGMTGLRIGLVTHAGKKQYGVCWESGHRRRYPQGYAHKIMDWAAWTDVEGREVQDRIFRHCQI